ncbi:MAG TPA: indole-3-glycerol phosphate synthase TrpC [Actinomycetota bacterium]|nr:indole-3-glycerol phosphate synthase TrpC [Actinomycetota bacterium]
MTSFLPRILEARRARVEADRAQLGIDELRREAELLGEPRGFEEALRAPGMSLIAEFKRASPSRGDLAPHLDPAVQAVAYEEGGARALSVLTESEFFKGSPQDLVRAREATQLPVLWKDFVLDPYQVVQARSFAADAVLVIVRILDDERLAEILAETDPLGMTALVEVFDEVDLRRALEAGARVVGVNHRDLETFEEDPQATMRLRKGIPPGVVTVAESAIWMREDVEAYGSIGVDAVLVGEALVRAPDPSAKVRELLGADL